MNSQKTNDTLSIVHRSFEDIDVLRELEGARVTELAEELNVAPSTAYNYLATLEAEKYVVKEGDQYHIGLEFLDIGTHAKYKKKVPALRREGVRNSKKPANASNLLWKSMD